jgi:hypothetical protein
VKLPLELMKKAAEHAEACKISPERYVAQALEQTFASEIIDRPQDEVVAEELVETIRARVAEENVSLPKFIRGMLRHALRGHDFSRIHFYRDGSGDAYNVDVLTKIHEQSMAELTTVRKYAR